MRNTLVECVILVAEDNALIALEIIDAFEEVGAVVLSAGALAEVIGLVEQGGLSAAVVDFGHSDKEAGSLCPAMKDGNIFFVLHSGYTHPDTSIKSDVAIPEHASPMSIIDSVMKHPY